MSDYFDYENDYDDDEQNDNIVTDEDLLNDLAQEHDLFMEYVEMLWEVIKNHPMFLDTTYKEKFISYMLYNSSAYANLLKVQVQLAK